MCNSEKTNGSSISMSCVACVSSLALPVFHSHWASQVIFVESSVCPANLIGFTVRYISNCRNRSGQEGGMGKLSGKTAVVTGASKGIGAAIAEVLGRNGANVVVNYASDKKGADRVVKAIEASGSKAVAVQADVSRKADVEKLFAETEKVFGGQVDVLVNNAGVYEFRPLEQVDEEHYHKLFDINVLGLLLATQAAVKRMNGGGGTVINISSIVSRQPVSASAVYAATKGAVDVITQELAQELGP